MRIVKPEVELFQYTPEADKLIERIARVCYNSEDAMRCDCPDGYCPACRARRDKFLSSLAGKRHDSVFEHASATFRVLTDRGITHELVRHRLASFTQSSTRYIKFREDLPVVEPLFRKEGERELWLAGVQAAEQSYQSLLAQGVPAENARDVLPTCTAATLFMTANLREWKHVLRLRTAPGAHPKIRYLAREILREILPLCPVYFRELSDPEEAPPGET
jgi:thymidylate synthase (FAD)